MHQLLNIHELHIYENQGGV
uniref:Uncharacterized protein n=1 Tax=Arundo donax TaxID=35708 RepID=A0A0A9C353_ARUDO